MALINWKLPGTSGEWGLPENWDSGTVPGSTDDVEFDASVTPYTVTITGLRDVNSLTINSPGSAGVTLDLQSNSFVTVEHDFSNLGGSGSNDAVTMNNATFAVGGDGLFGSSGANHLDWTLTNRSFTTFYGSVKGTGITITFGDSTSDNLTLGNNGIIYSGSIVGFQGRNEIDLSSIQYTSGGWSSIITESGALEIDQGGTPKFLFNSFTFGGSNTIADLRITSSDGTGTGGLLLTVCFTAGTRIAAESDEIAVEELQPGHRVVTLQAGVPVLQEVRWVGRRQLDLRSHPQVKAVAPVRISANAFADGVPHRDLIVSPDHAVLADGGLIPARMLINGMTIRQETGLAGVEYFHVELDSHSILLAEGLATESYLETGHRGFFSNAAEPTILYPDMTADEQARAEAQPCAPFMLDEASVRPVWQRLHDRATAAGLVRETPETTRDAELRVLAGGREFQPMEVASGRYVFALPAGLRSARLVSRAAAPADSHPWLNDRRQLGVAVERIELHSADGTEDVAIDHPALSHGWWDAERAANGIQRWTNGDATIPLPTGPVLLELTLAGTGFYPLAASEGTRHAA